ncbi:MAG: amidohydrolase [Rhodothermales bacterium]
MTPLQADIPDIANLDLVVDALSDPSALPAALLSFVREVRRHMHRHPELGFEEHATSAFLRNLLTRHGLDVHGPVAETGLWVDIVGRQDGPLVAYRADIDALPTQDAKSTDYASKNTGVAHLCGHDAHSAIAVAIALILHQNKERLKGAVRVFFQPNEEGMPGGASSMIDAGVLEDVQSVYAIHVDPTLEVGKYGLLAGPITAATDQFNVRIKAPSTGHSARPHESVDTIWVATEIANTLYQLIGRVTDARNPSVLTICRFHAGHAFNVIPDEVEFGGTLRTTNLEDRKAIIHHIRRLTNDLATIHGAVAEIDIHGGAPPVNNDPRLVKHVERTVRSYAGDRAVFHIPRPSMGSEDFAHYLEHVPGLLLRVGTYSSPESAYPLHDAHFDIDERALAATAALLSRTLLEHLDAGILTT